MLKAADKEGLSGQQKQRRGRAEQVDLDVKSSERLDQVKNHKVQNGHKLHAQNNTIDKLLRLSRCRRR